MAEVAVATHTDPLELARRRRPSRSSGGSRSTVAATRPPSTTPAGTNKYIPHLMRNMKWEDDFKSRIDTIGTGMTVNDDQRKYAMSILGKTLSELFPDKITKMPSVLRKEHTWDDTRVTEEFKSTMAELQALVEDEKRKKMIEGFEKYSKGGISDYVFKTIRRDSRFYPGLAKSKGKDTTTEGVASTIGKDASDARSLGAGTIGTTRVTETARTTPRSGKGKKGVFFGAETEPTTPAASETAGSRVTLPDGKPATEKNKAEYKRKIEAMRAAKSAASTARDTSEAAREAAASTIGTRDTKDTRSPTTADTAAPTTVGDLFKLTPEARRQRVTDMLSGKGASTTGTKATTAGTSVPVTLDAKTKDLVKGLSAGQPPTTAASSILDKTSLPATSTSPGKKIDPDNFTATSLTDAQRSRIQSRMKKFRDATEGTDIKDATGNTLDTAVDKWTQARTEMNETLRNMGWTTPPTTAGDTRKFKRTQKMFDNGDIAVLTFYETENGKQIVFDRHKRVADDSDKAAFDFGTDAVVPSTTASTRQSGTMAPSAVNTSRVASTVPPTASTLGRLSSYLPALGRSTTASVTGSTIAEPRFKAAREAALASVGAKSTASSKPQGILSTLGSAVSSAKRAIGV